MLCIEQTYFNIAEEHVLQSAHTKISLPRGCDEKMDAQHVITTGTLFLSLTSNPKNHYIKTRLAVENVCEFIRNLITRDFNLYAESFTYNFDNLLCLIRW